MAEEMQSPKKVAFGDKKYSNEEKRKKEEEELQELIAAQKGESSTDSTESTASTEEEETFKKRYADLRRHSQQQSDELKGEIANLREQLSAAAKKELKLPKSDEDLEQWCNEYKDVSDIIKTLAAKQAKEQNAELEQRMSELTDMQESVKREKAEAELLSYHPDFEEIRESEEFHEWVKVQPQAIQSMLYVNSMDAKLAAQAVDYYKNAKNIRTPNRGGAAESVSTKNRAGVEGKQKTQYKESQIAAMSIQEYEKHQDKILDAMRTGNFEYDIKGAAR